jgi:hypothetical protein
MDMHTKLLAVTAITAVLSFTSFSDGARQGSAAPVQLAKLTASFGDTADRLGSQVSISGNTAIATAPDDQLRHSPLDYVLTYDKPVGGWKNATQTASLGGDSRFTSVAISGNTLVMGAPGTTVGSNPYQGAAWIFSKKNGVWTQVAELTASDGQQDDELGIAVAINGNTVVVATPQYDTFNTGNGAAYVFVEPASGWVNATENGKLTASDGLKGDWLGYSVALTSTTVVAGAPGRAAGEGAAYVFVKPSSGWQDMTQTALLTNTDFNFLGASVSISGDTVVAGATYAGNINQGAAEIYVKPSSGWVDMTQTAELTASDGLAFDQLGASVSISGSTVVAGAPQNYQTMPNGPGAAYVFVKPPSGWKNMHERWKLTASDGALADAFGSSVSISGSTIVAGAPNATVNSHTTQGAAYIYGIQ